MYNVNVIKEENWEKLNAGEELDKIVGDRIGWNPDSGWWWYVDAAKNDGTYSIKSSVYPQYSKDWKAVGNVIEFAEAFGFHVDIKKLSSKGVCDLDLYEVCFTEGGHRRRHVGQGETIPMAVVRSFLKATETRESTLNIC